MGDLKKILLDAAGKPLLDPKTGLVGRVFERTQGCWNCKHVSYEAAVKFWAAKRQQDLNAALQIAMASPQGEDDQKVKNIRAMIDAIDTGIATHNLTMCTGKGVDASDNPVGDLVKTTYLCRKWSGAQGASIARAGEAADPLPMELDDKTS